jgi:hypothetical protein
VKSPSIDHMKSLLDHLEAILDQSTTLDCRRCTVGAAQPPQAAKTLFCPWACKLGLREVRIVLARAVLDTLSILHQPMILLTV